MNVLARILKRAATTVECGHHWHRQFTGVWHCCGCWIDNDIKNQPKGTGKCVRSGEDTFEFLLPPAGPITATSTSSSRRRKRAGATA